jgi:hypothetical protein
MTDEIDDMVRAAAKAHEGLASADYFEGLAARVLVRLERDESFASEVSMMSDTPPSKDTSTSGSGGDEAHRPGPSDDSGLHDMKALAQTAKRRISRRITSQHDAYDESLLSSSHSGLRAVALPVSAQVVSLPEVPGARPGSDSEATAAGATATGAAVTPIGAAAERKKRKAMWLVGGGLLAAAAAAVVIVAGGGSKQDGDDASGPVAIRGESAAAQTTGAAPACGAPALAPGAVGGGEAMAPPAEPTEIAAADPSAAEDRAAAGKLEEKLQDKEAAKEARGDGGGSVAPPPTDKPRKVDGKDVKPGGPGTPAADKVKKPGADKGAAGDKPAPTTGDQTIDDLLNAASGGAQKPTTGGGGGGEVKPEKTSLDTKDIKAGMGAVAGKAQSCFDQHGVAGHVKIKATVDPSGKVTKADATGEFAGTPTGACVAGHVKGTSFASWTGAPMTINYGFTLQE